MPEVYTCTCGCQFFWLHGAKISCSICKTEYTLMWDVGIDGQMESPEDFNKRIRDDLLSDLVNKQEG